MSSSKQKPNLYTVSCAKRGDCSIIRECGIRNVECMISHIFKFTKVPFRKIIKNIMLLVSCFPFFFFIYEGVITLKNEKKSGIGVVYTSGVSF